MKSRPNRFAAYCTLLAITIAQLVTAAYACPLIEAALTPPAASVDMPEPCEQMGKTDPADPSLLCLEHCKAGQQLVDNHSPVDAFTAAPVLSFFFATFVVDTSSRVANLEPLRATAAAPPVFASSGRLRI